MIESNHRRGSVMSQQSRALHEDGSSDQRRDFAVLAHELREPLHVIRTTTHLLRLPNLDDAAVARVADILDRQIEQMACLIENLLDVARITHGKIQLHKKRVDLTALLARIARTTDLISADASVQLTVRLPPEPLWLDADVVRLEQVFVNLLGNAVKFTDPGGQVCLTAERLRDQAVVWVRDNGIGIAPEMLPRIFSVFVQAERAQEHAPGGLGFGLALVRSLVELHGGRVQAWSDGPGKGSEFVVRLPISSDA